MIRITGIGADIVTAALDASVSRPEQLPALMASTTLQLSDADVALLDATSAPFA